MEAPQIEPMPGLSFAIVANAAGEPVEEYRVDGEIVSQAAFEAESDRQETANLDYQNRVAAFLDGQGSEAAGNAAEAAARESDRRDAAIEELSALGISQSTLDFLTGEK